MPTDTAPESIANRKSEIANLLHRPRAERLREYKYRFAQSIVFGLPVVALHYFGSALGGPEARRWSGLLQILLTGWVMYVGALGMLVDALLRRRVTVDGVVAAIALVLYLISVAAVVYFLATIQALLSRQWFAHAVILLCVWTGVQWFRHAHATE